MKINPTKLPHYGRKVTADLSALVEQLNELSQRLAHGDGTAAKLINDPQIYDAVNDIVVGVEESKLLRWLLRNRQKAGIKKRYDDAQATPSAVPPTDAKEPSVSPPVVAPPTPPPATEPPPVPPVNDPAAPPPSGPREE